MRENVRRPGAPLWAAVVRRRRLLRFAHARRAVGAGDWHGRFLTAASSGVTLLHNIGYAAGHSFVGRGDGCSPTSSSARRKAPPRWSHG